MISRPSFTFSPESLLSDIRSCLDSYAVEVYRAGLITQRFPLHGLRYRVVDPPNWDAPAVPVLNPTIDIRLCQFTPAKDDFLNGIRERKTRWPFFVIQPMIIVLTLGDQWWQYNFTPGKFYEDRRI